MFDLFGSDLTVREASFWAGLLLGCAFGALAEASGFCLRRAVTGPGAGRREPAAMWLAALAAAIAGTQLLQSAGLVDLSGHRFLTAHVPVVAIILGGLVFGIGMVLTRGCPARLTVLAAGGNLRAGTVLLVLSVTALAAMKGLLAPGVMAILGQTLPLPHPAQVPLAGVPLAGVALPVVLILVLVPMRAGIRQIACGIAIGALVPLGWLATGNMLLDDFEPIPLESFSFIAPVADTLFWTVAATAITPGFGVGLVLGTFAGAAISAQIGRRAGWRSFSSPRETGRYALGAAMMGVGGVLAGGCTIGAGLTGVSALSASALLALASILVSAHLADRLIDRPARGA